MSYDELELDTLGDRKTALFLIMSDTDDTFNFVIAILQSQLFNLLCDKADDEYNGKLPVHVRFLLDEFANIGQIPRFDKLIATIRSREMSASIILQSQSQLKAIYKDAAEIILDNADSTLFLGGRGKNAKDISDNLGRETIDSFNTSENRGTQVSHGLTYQKLGKELMTQDEIAVMDGGKCILQLRGVRPFLSDKYDITKHPNYKYLSDFDKKNAFDTVEWWNAKGRYDLVYKSRVFTDTYSKDTITVTNAEQVIFGGTGYDTKNRLPPEVEHSYPDYSIYPQFFGIAYGFLSRGCPRNCGFCIVSSKEGRKSVKVADLSEFWKWQPEIKIMDANLLACPDHENLIEQLIRSRAWVDFSQGLDIRLVNRDNVSLLNRVRIKAVHFAWDNPDEDLTGYFQRFLDLTAIKSSRQRRVYVLTNYGSTHEQDLYRVNTLRAMGFDPYVMIYERPTAPPVTRHLQRWVNNKRLFYAVPRFEDYIPGRKEV